MSAVKLSGVGVFLLSIVYAQAPPQVPLFSPNVTFGSSFQLTPEQTQRGNFSAVTARNIGISLDFERTNWANGSVETEPFYDITTGEVAASSDSRAGTLLKVQRNANASAYTVPPNTALSRILYQTETLNGTSAPASAFVLWPYLPRKTQDGKFQTVVWAHGSSGTFGACGPSHIRNLWYQFAAPHTLALQGYVVVAPDYLGLGLNRDASGNVIRHPFLALPSHANDMIYAVEAAQSAFPELSKEFVAIGHSQGGGAAWAVAERQARRPVPGYLGTVAGSPVTDLYAEAAAAVAVGASTGPALLIGNGVQQVFPQADLSRWLNPLGLARLDLLREIQGCNSALDPFIADGQKLAQPGLLEDGYFRAYANASSVGVGAPFAGPMLVLEGTADTSVPFAFVNTSVAVTCAAHPQSRLAFAIFQNCSHVPVMYASQRVWLGWIADRFAGKPISKGCEQTVYESAQPYELYHKEIDWFLEPALLPYEVA